MIDARECAALALQCGEAAYEAGQEFHATSGAKADAWLKACEALNDAQEALQRAADAIEAVGTAR